MESPHPHALDPTVHPTVPYTVLQLSLYASVWASVSASVKWDVGLGLPHGMLWGLNDTTHVKCLNHVSAQQIALPSGDGEGFFSALVSSCSA